ncbi:MAG: M23 family metallopeptidase [Bacteroidales bacterium]
MRRVLFILFSLLTFNLVAQERVQGLRVPVNIPVSLSGNYGELRATHFHAGIDIRVGGVSGSPLYAAMDGFISRISVSPTGYGHAIYIDHPNGRTTLYGHMQEFAPAIASWVRDQQYSAQSFSINLNPEKSQFPVKKGDYIGKAGNTGSSGGPHLHFEVRETSTQIPLNPLKENGIKVQDNIAPEFRKINLYSLGGAYSIPQSKLIKSFTMPVQEVISVPDTFYVAVAGHDRQNNTSAKLAVSKYSFFLDNNLLFSFIPDNIPFDKGRYINSIVEYPEKDASGISMIKSRVEPGGDLKSNIESVQDGLFVLNDNEIHQVKVKLEDEHGNASERTIKVRRDTSLNLNIEADSLKFRNGIVMPWFLPNRFESEGIRFMLPPGALYSSILFTADTIRREINATPGKIWRLHDSRTPIHNSARVALKSPYSDSLSAKALIVKIDEKGDISSAGGSFNNGWIETFTGAFGDFAVALDTIKPNIVPSFKTGANLAGRAALRISIKDNLSGIKDYKVTIDGVWILTSYDPKNRRLEVELKGDRVKKGKRHSIEIWVWDNKENVNHLKSSFIW